jgi:hypothetical protein
MNFNYQKYKETIFSQNFDFNQITLQVFDYQYNNNEIYQDYCNLLKKNQTNIKDIKDIPFLPVDFFKHNKIISGTKSADLIFTSSATTQQIPSKHYVVDTEIYEQSFLTTFEEFYGSPCNYNIIGLLPSYLERQGSSLVYMLRRLIELSDNQPSGFFLNDYQNLLNVVEELEHKCKKYIIFGVSYALLDFSQLCTFPLKNGIIIETGGMKGKRTEIIKEDLHLTLKQNFKTENIHSEYGMTELLSQAYSTKYQLFRCPNYMKVLVSDLYDPLTLQSKGKGKLNIIDLANINSCTFIATDDLGEIFYDGSFKIIGRANNAEIRGCNLLVD